MWRLAICLALALAVPATAQTLRGVTLGEPVPDGLPEPLGMQVIQLYSITVWTLEDGLSMSTTADAGTGSVLYIELWRDNGQGTQSAPIDGVTFGETTHADLTDRFGSAGIIFNERGRYAVVPPNVAHFTSYEIEGSDAVASFVTIQPLDEATPETIGNAVLDSISLGQGPYLDQIWGGNRGRLEGYTRIAFPFTGQ